MEMKIESAFVKVLLQRILKRTIRKKINCDIDIELRDFCAEIKDGRAIVDISAKGEIPADEFKKLLKGAGLA